MFQYRGPNCYESQEDEDTDIKGATIASLEIYLRAIYYLCPHSYLHASIERRCDRTSNDIPYTLSLRSTAIKKARKKTYLESEIDRDQEGKKEDIRVLCRASSEPATEKQKGYAVETFHIYSVGKYCLCR